MSKRPSQREPLKSNTDQYCSGERSLLISLAECIRIWRKLEACLDEIYRPLSPSDAIFAGISRDFAGIFSRAHELFYEIHIGEAI